jgi:hypothetical protein
MLKKEVTLMLKYMSEPYMIAIVEVGEDYTDRVVSIKTDRCSLKEAQQIAKDAGYQVITDLCTIVHTIDGAHIIVAVEPQ